MAPCPWPSAWSIACRYTSVLPLPVTPCSRNTLSPSGLASSPTGLAKRSIAAMTDFSATACSAFNSSGSDGRMWSMPYGSRSEICGAMLTSPLSSSLRMVDDVVPASRTSSCSGSSRHSSTMFQRSVCRLVSLGNSPGTGRARTNNRSRHPSASLRTASGSTAFIATSGAQQ